MLLDALQQVADAQDWTAVAVSASSIDLGNVTPKRQPGTGEPMGFGFFVTTAADCTTVKLEAIMATDAALTTGIIVLAERTCLAADLAAGLSWFLSLPPSAPAAGWLRYVGVRVTPVGGNATVSLDAFLMPYQLYAAKVANYAKGYTIS